MFEMREKLETGEMIKLLKEVILLYQHVKQYNPFCCGAACMQMVYDYYNLPITQEEIWKEIARPNPYCGLECGPDEMQRHFHSNGFCSLCVAAKMDPGFLFKVIEEKKYSAIVNYALGENHNHFVLFERLHQKSIIVQDPSLSTPNTLINFDELIDLQTMIISKSTKQSKCPMCRAAFPSNNDFDIMYSEHVARCVYCGEELYYVEPI